MSQEYDFIDLTTDIASGCNVALSNGCKYEEYVNPRCNTDDINSQFDENHDSGPDESMVTSPNKERHEE
ncbi:hypothetical protein RMATCC62417_10602 [Rhizopus microsporus]|nr:hypothetical protein RMATCC62417_10602 [Rhizopus microsporus]